MAEQPKEDASLMMAQITVMYAAVISLFETHPNPTALRAVFERKSETYRGQLVHSSVSEEAIALADRYHRLLLAATSRGTQPPADATAPRPPS